MSINNKIRALRELNNWSQEEMAQKMNLSKNGYARIERGEGKLSLERLQQIANIFQIDIEELMATGNNGILWIGLENSGVISHSNNETLTAEIERLKLMLQHKDELLNQKDREIELLEILVKTLKPN